MSGGERVPKSFPLFDAWIRRTNTRQLATNPDTGNPYWTDYGWTLTESGFYTTEWHDKWVNNIYPKIIDPTTNTSPQKAKATKHIEDFIKYDHQHHLLDKIVICGKANADDAALFNVDLERDEPTHLSSKIETKPWASVDRSGPATFDIMCRSAADSSRASIDREAGASSVQYAYAILDHYPQENEVLNPDDTKKFIKDISEKAHFPLDVGAENRRQYLVIYFRWYNKTYPQFAGDWTEMVVVIIG